MFYGRNSSGSNYGSSFSVAWAKYEDIRRLVEIEFFAFEDEKTNHILSYRDHNQPAHYQRAVRSYQAAMNKAATQRRRVKSNVRRKSLQPSDLDASTL